MRKDPPMSEDALDIIEAISQETGEPIDVILENAVELYEYVHRILREKPVGQGDSIFLKVFPGCSYG